MPVYSTVLAALALAAAFLWGAGELNRWLRGKQWKFARTAR